MPEEFPWIIVGVSGIVTVDVCDIYGEASLLIPKIGSYIQGCQFSDFSLISDFLRIKENSIKLIKYS